jgi:hypothetical protein
MHEPSQYAGGNLGRWQRDTVREESNLKSDSRWDGSDSIAALVLQGRIMCMEDKIPFNDTFLTDDRSFYRGGGSRAADASALSLILEGCGVWRGPSRACCFPIKRNGGGNGRSGGRGAINSQRDAAVGSGRKGRAVG